MASWYCESIHIQKIYDSEVFLVNLTCFWVFFAAAHEKVSGIDAKNMGIKSNVQKYLTFVSVRGEFLLVKTESMVSFIILKQNDVQDRELIFI